MGTLDAACGIEPAVKILALVALGPRRCRQPLALDWKKSLIFGIFAAFDPNHRPARRHRKVD
ncbi:hypothetical protein C7441_12712 [Pseudaminobacter salicylatoxidans]|uniref:Uncharacterized protein n=1 Tax=Pseudaminobacter salicylatoxidans TaxID=93369 RepID=A0A316BQ57_PSESE|nr:hypothetical protein C7441_12712 [Pseudaminobacter salicylatoxidans]